MSFLSNFKPIRVLQSARRSREWGLPISLKEEWQLDTIVEQQNAGKITEEQANERTKALQTRKDSK